MVIKMIVIITKQQLDLKDVMIINDEIEMIDDYSFYYNNTIINFDLYIL